MFFILLLIACGVLLAVEFQRLCGPYGLHARAGEHELREPGEGLPEGVGFWDEEDACVREVAVQARDVLLESGSAAVVCVLVLPEVEGAAALGAGVVEAFLDVPLV